MGTETIWDFSLTLSDSLVGQMFTTYTHGTLMQVALARVSARSHTRAYINEIDRQSMLKLTEIVFHCDFIKHDFFV